MHASSSALRSIGPALVAVATLSFASPAYADATALRSTEHGDWPATLTALQNDIHADGHAIHVYALDAAGARIRCGHYALRPDTVAREAFAVATCDPSTDATEVRLAHRSALFTHDGVVPMLRSAVISVDMVSAPGEATAPAECTLEIHPWLRDVEQGTRVDLTPARFEVVLPTGVRADVVGDHWLLRAPRGAANQVPDVAYQIVETQRRAVVFSAHRLLECPGAPAEDAVEPTTLAAAPNESLDTRPVVQPHLTLQETNSRRDELYTGHAPGGTYDTGRSLAIAGGSLAFLAFTGAGAVLYIALQSSVMITPEFLLWTTGIGGGVIVLGGVIAGVGGLLAVTDRSHERPRDGVRLLGLGVAPTGVNGGLSAGATFSF